MRRRVHLQQGRSRVSSRIRRLLDLYNIKLSSVLKKMTGRTARSILEGLATAKTIKPEALALLATHKRADPSGLPSLFTALRSQLGLQLRPGKATLEVLGIDSVERPADN